MSADIGFPAVVSRGLRSAGGGLVVLAIVVFVATGTLALWPGATAAVLTAELKHSVSTTGPVDRDLRATIIPGGEQGLQTTETVAPGWARLGSTLRSVRSRLPADLRAATGPGRYIGSALGTSAGILTGGSPTIPPDTVSHLVLEANPDLSSDAVLTAGRWPRPATAVHPGATIEVAISKASSDRQHWTLGQTQTVSIGSAQGQKFLLVGIVTPRKASSDYWQLNSLRAKTAVTYSSDGTTKYLQSLVWVAPSSFPLLADDFGDSTFEAWFPVGASTLDVHRLATVQSELQKFLSSPPTLPPDAQPMLFSTQLDTVLNTFVARAGPANTLLTIFSTGPLGTALAVLALGVRRYVVRRRPAFTLMLARGGSPLRLRTLAGAETAVATVPAAVIGWILGVTVGGTLLAGALPLLVLAILLPPLVTAVALPLRTGPRATAEGGRPRDVWILEVVLVGLALVSVFILQRGGLSSSTPLSPDPLLVACPLLVAFAVCVVVLRVYTSPMRWIGGLVRRGRGAVSSLGWATSTRSPGGVVWPLFAIITGVSIAVFSLAFLTTERTGIESAAAAQVGADIAVTAPTLTTFSPSQVKRIRAVPGVRAIAPVINLGGVSLSNGLPDAIFYVANASDLRAVQSRLPVTGRTLSGLVSSGGEPARAVGGGFNQHAPSRVTLQLSPTPITVDLGTRAAPPGDFISDDTWLLLDESRLPRTDVQAGRLTTILVGVEPGASAPTITADLRTIAGSGAGISDTAQTAADLRTTPLVPGVERFTLAALLLSALMAVGAMVLTVVMSSDGRTRLVATLRTLGFSRRQTLALSAWELAPPVIAGIIAGSITGVLLPRLLLRVINLAAFTGGSTRPPLIIDPTATLGVAAAFVVAAAAATGLALAIARRASPSTVLREKGDE